MGTYSKLLTEAHENNKPVGPKHHNFDRQLQEWIRRNPQAAAKVEETVKKHAAEKPPAKSSTPKPTTKPSAPVPGTDLSALKARLNGANRKLEAEQSLVGKYKSEQRKKIADGYKTPSWQESVDKIPSRGNGL